MKCFVYSLFVIIFVIIFNEVKCSDDVPAILWNVKGDALNIRPVSAFEVTTKKSMQDFVKEHLSKKSTAMLVFLTEEFSFEDLASESAVSSDGSLQVLEEFLDAHPHMLLPHVQDPVKCLHNVDCEKEELHISGKVDEGTLQMVTSALDRSCLVVIHLKNSEAAPHLSKAEIDAVMDIMSSLSTSKKNVIGMFTAMKSSWSSSEKQHTSRGLLALDAGEQTSNSFVTYNNSFFNYSSCIIMYATNITIKNEEPINDTLLIVPFDYDLSESECNVTNGSSVLVINFLDVKKYSTLIIRMTFEKGEFGLWNLGESSVTIDDHTERIEPSYPVSAPLGFSFSCAPMSFHTPNSTIKYTIKMDGFQIQPFEVQNVFSPSFDCIPFFTLPIWMGLMIGILFITILSTGINALFAVKTMDRFDDPKGKTISVALGAE